MGGFQVGAHPFGLSPHVSDFQFIECLFEFIQFGAIELFAFRQRASHTGAALVGFESSELPFAAIGLQFRIEFPFFADPALQHVQRSGVVLQGHSDDVKRRHLQQVFLDPVGELGRQRRIIEFHCIDDVLAGTANVSLACAIFDFITDDQRYQGRAFPVLERHQSPDPFGAHFHVARRRIEHTKSGVVFAIGRAHIENAVI